MKAKTYNIIQRTSAGRKIGDEIYLEGISYDEAVEVIENKLENSDKFKYCIVGTDPEDDEAMNLRMKRGIPKAEYYYLNLSNGETVWQYEDMLCDFGDYQMLIEEVIDAISAKEFDEGSK